MFAVRATEPPEAEEPVSLGIAENEDLYSGCDGNVWCSK